GYAARTGARTARPRATGARHRYPAGGQPGRAARASGQERAARTQGTGNEGQVLAPGQVAGLSSAFPSRVGCAAAGAKRNRRVRLPRMSRVPRPSPRIPPPRKEEGPGSTLLLSPRLLLPAHPLHLLEEGGGPVPVSVG